MRDPATYRGRRRNLARQLMLKMRDKGEPPNWRLAWATVQAAVKVPRRRPARGGSP